MGISHCFTTNTTSRPRSAILRELSVMGLTVEPECLFTAPRAAREYLLAKGFRRCHLMVNRAVLEDFTGIEQEDSRPQAVVLGDLGEGFTFERVNRAFRLLLDGAKLVTLARNRYFRAEDGLTLDAGPFAAALEYASGRSATVVGKPSKEFFGAALRFVGASPAESAIVGDATSAEARSSGCAAFSFARESSARATWSARRWSPTLSSVP